MNTLHSINLIYLAKIKPIKPNNGSRVYIRIENYLDSLSLSFTV